MRPCEAVCLDMGFDAEDNDFCREVARKARKPHQCCECREPILPRQVYWLATGKMDGTIWSNATCALCYEIRCAFVCGSWIFGELWTQIREVMFPVWQTEGPIDCLAKVETLAARDKLRAKYVEWHADEAARPRRR